LTLAVVFLNRENDRPRWLGNIRNKLSRLYHSWL